MESKLWIVNYRQFAKGRRSNKQLLMPGEKREEVREMFDDTMQMARKINPLKFNHVKVISIYQEV